jgi:hypothetical protein
MLWLGSNLAICGARQVTLGMRCSALAAAIQIRHRCIRVRTIVGFLFAYIGAELLYQITRCPILTLRRVRLYSVPVDAALERSPILNANHQPTCSPTV